MPGLASKKDHPAGCVRGRTPWSIWPRTEPGPPSSSILERYHIKLQG